MVNFPFKDIEDKELMKFKLDTEMIAEELARTLKIPYFNLQITKPEIDALKYVNKELAEKAKAIPIKKEKNRIILGVIDPYNEDFLKLKESLEKQGFEVSFGIISSKSLEIGLEEYRFLSQKRISYIKTFEINPEVLKEVEEKITRKEELQNLMKNIIQENPFLILDYLIAGALKFNASDLHFEPQENQILTKYRLDGMLYEIFSFPRNIYNLLKNRIKVLSGLMINITHKPQDGSFSLNLPDKKIDLRVSVIPSSYDEAIVMRILNFNQVMKKLEDLGLRSDDLEILEKAILAPNGLILTTGPTGSGKTTLLYAILLKIKKPELKIITIENPIEYHLEGIQQTQVDENKGFTFSVALRSFLRHDPDIILVGEIRDKETAETALQASLTGHLVLSTLHTNDSLGAIPRLISLGVDPKLIPPAIRLIIAQRLVRKACPNCREEYCPDENLKNKIKEKLKNLPERVKLKVNLDNFVLVKTKGCFQCFETGYQGRIGIFELLRITKDLEELIYQKPSEAEILKIVEKDFVNLQQDALIKALEKITTLEEVERVTGIL